MLEGEHGDHSGYSRVVRDEVREGAGGQVSWGL